MSANLDASGPPLDWVDTHTTHAYAHALTPALPLKPLSSPLMQDNQCHPVIHK